MKTLHWGDDFLAIEIAWDDSSAVGLRGISSRGARVAMADAVPLVEIVTVGAGHEPASDRLDHSQIGRALRYVAHVEERDSEASRLRVTQLDAVRGIEATITLESPNGSGCIRASVDVVNVGGSRAVLRSVTSWSSAFGGTSDEGAATSADATPRADRDGFESWELVSGTGEWLGEGRWTRRGIREAGLVGIREDLTGHDRRSSIGASSYGTWSTGGALPVAGIESTSIGAAWLWQIEHNGGWRWEIGENLSGGVFSLSGPTDRDHAFTLALAPGEQFTTVPVTVAFAGTFAAALDQLTTYRRAARRPHVDNERDAGGVQRLHEHPQRRSDDAASSCRSSTRRPGCGAEVFCIDAGWYDDSGSLVGQRRRVAAVDDALPRGARRGHRAHPPPWHDRPACGSSPRWSACAARSPTSCPTMPSCSAAGQRVDRARALPPRPAAPAGGRAPGRRGRSARGRVRHRVPQARLQHRTRAREPTSPRTASATACSSTTAPTSPGSTACSTAIPNSSSRTAPRVPCEWTSRCCRGCHAVDLRPAGLPAVPADRRVRADLDAARAGGELGVPAAGDDRRGGRVLPGHRAARPLLPVGLPQPDDRRPA